MNDYTFVSPTDYYDERIVNIDEEICRLLQKRKSTSENNPGFPTMNYISQWSQRYDLDEEYLTSLFSTMYNEEFHKPRIEPKNFQKNIPFLKGVNTEKAFYSITMISQFENASKLFLNTIFESTENKTGIVHREATYFEITITGNDKIYTIQHQGGSGSMENEINEYIIAPALPDDLSDIHFKFIEKYYSNKETGVTFQF